MLHRPNIRVHALASPVLWLLLRRLLLLCYLYRLRLLLLQPVISVQDPIAHVLHRAADEIHCVLARVELACRIVRTYPRPAHQTPPRDNIVSATDTVERGLDTAVSDRPGATVRLVAVRVRDTPRLQCRIPDRIHARGMTSSSPASKCS
ncbi:hypothetical protein C8Q77DRAFT_261928 [Trametes polyzona]|nr:hypothetical protein C8Q77DRAFT_261928 [Trametes polyzona]